MTNNNPGVEGDEENVAKIVEVVQCLRDESDGHREYILQDPERIDEWRYHQEDLANVFWDTNLHNDEPSKAVHHDRIGPLWERVHDR